jgi:hypothetical protein
MTDIKGLLYFLSAIYLSCLIVDSENSNLEMNDEYMKSNWSYSDKLSLLACETIKKVEEKLTPESEKNKKKVICQMDTPRVLNYLRHGTRLLFLLK